jgi:2'-5' RNA ligase
VLPGKVVIPDNWHFTLRFLGATDAERRDELIARLSIAPLGRPFTITFGELGAFPNPRRARVLWLGVAAGDEAFRALGAAVEEVVTAAGYEAEKRAFTPHLTLARINPPQSITSLLSTARAIRTGATNAKLAANSRPAMRVDSVVLYRSQLGAGSPHYDEIARFCLTA